MKKEIKQHFLLPGVIFADCKPSVVTTVLGSCVAVCLWDAVLKIGGMNHFQLPLWNGEGLATPKYGNIAIEKLVEKMERLGSSTKNLQAKLFGGGEVLNKGKGGILNIGQRNIIVASDMLVRLKIPVVASSIGGTHGRKLKYFTEVGTVILKPIKPN